MSITPHWTMPKRMMCSGERLRLPECCRAKLRVSDRSQVRALAERCSTQDDRAEWSWLESLPRLLAGCPLHGLETLETLEVTHGTNA